MRTLIRCLDTLVRRACGVFEFSDDDDCVLRLQLKEAPHTLHLKDCAVEAGQPVLGLHLWNEHLPPLPPTGPDLAWASQMRRLFMRSLHTVARQMRLDPRLARVRAVGGASALFSPTERPGGVRLMQRLGFTVMPYRSPLGQFGEFWENFYSWWIMWTFNAVSLRHRRLIRLRRTEIWMSTQEFLERYGTDSAKNKRLLTAALGEPQV